MPYLVPARKPLFFKKNTKKTALYKSEWVAQNKFTLEKSNLAVRI